MQINHFTDYFFKAQYFKLSHNQCSDLQRYPTLRLFIVYTYYHQYYQIISEI